MEDTLGAVKLDFYAIEADVLILVLMEDTLGEVLGCMLHRRSYVLILVLMEDTLGDRISPFIQFGWKGLNPCSNGRYSRSDQVRNFCCQ